MGRLGDDEARQHFNQPHLAHFEKPLTQRADIAEIAAGYDDPIGHGPVVLLHHLYRYRFLAFEPQRIH